MNSASQPRGTRKAGLEKSGLFCQLEAYLHQAATEGRYHLEHARLEGLEVRDLEVEIQEWQGSYK